MTAVLIAVCVVAVIAALVKGVKAGPKKPTAPSRSTTGASSGSRSQSGVASPATTVEPLLDIPTEDANISGNRTPFAEPGYEGAIFTYGGSGSGALDRTINGPFAVLDFQTTGLSPRGRDRIVEVAVVRIEDGVVGVPWSTLVNPGRDTGATFIHHISSADVARAPTFAEIAPYLLSMLDGAVIVAHNATFDEEFLAAELNRSGFRNVRMPAICTLWLAQQTMRTANHKLPTLARELSVPMTNYVSRDHVVATASVLLHALQKYPRPVRHGCDPFRWTGGTVAPPRVVNRVKDLRKGTDGYMSSLMSKLPANASDVDAAEQEVYLEVLASAMADGQITREEAQQLGSLAGEAGMSSISVSALNQRFLETMREAAFADAVLTAAELRDLRRAAKALGIPSYFDDLVPTARAGARPAGGEGSSRPTSRKCGHCGQVGHYRPRCPELAADR